MIGSGSASLTSQLSALVSMATVGFVDMGDRDDFAVLDMTGMRIRGPQQAGGQFAFDPFLAQPPRGACSSYTMGGNVLATGFNLASAGRPLDLGSVTANSAGNNVPLTSPKAGLYSTLLGGGYPPIAPFFASGVIPSLHASGGGDGKSFDVPVPSGVVLAGSSLQALAQINRSTSATISWNAQGGVSASVVGSVYRSEERRVGKECR